MKNLTFDLYHRSGWQPMADVYRCADGWLVKVELAGVAQQDIRIKIQHDLLIIEGQRKDWCSPESREALSMEITYDWFQRTIQLSDAIIEESMRTEYREGMLLIYLQNRS
jgi:HSP20 family protein